ncbi:MAG: GWxTD domain-containing protein [Balneolaceae bacterium]|nr:GWxTD domain-containing protein [Balneolaceae bacterium]
MLSFIHTISFSLAVLLMGIAAEIVQAQPQRAYDRGIEELNRGNVSQALDIWYNSYDQSQEVDSRIGFEFIRVVTEEGMRSYYESATKMYYLALTKGVGINSRIAIRQEIERLEPIAGEGYYRQWMEWWDERNPALESDMHGYWIQQDPTPAHLKNERLIEHWDRIAAARQSFTRNQRTVYGTDDRALILIRYGEPDRVKNGILTIQSFNLKPWLAAQLYPSEERRRSRDSESSELQDPEIRDQEIINRLSDAIYRWHRYPEYEIWFYDNIFENQRDPTIFMFGTDVRNDQFALQTSLEDFIPERAYNPERERPDEVLEFTRAGITPALMLQLLYYEQLAEVDPFFETRLNALRDNVLDQGIEAFRGIDEAFRSESQELVNQRAIQAPRERSTYEGVIPRIPLEVQHYRFLDDSLRPYILTYVESSAYEAFMIDYHRTRGRNTEDADFLNGENLLEGNPYYELVHSLQSYDENWGIIELQQEHPPLYASLSTGNRMSGTVFKLPHTNRKYQAASVELMNYDPDSEPVHDTPFSPALRGWNKQQFRQPPPLKSHTDSLEVADLVLGYLDPDGRTTEPFSFAVANTQEVPFGETLLLHFEVYNLERMYDGFTQFELTYRIFPVDERGNVLMDQTEFILTLNFVNEDRTIIEDLEIETADLQPGVYELVVTIQDIQSEQSKERKIRFEVVN